MASARKAQGIAHVTPGGWGNTASIQRVQTTALIKEHAMGPRQHASVTQDTRATTVPYRQRSLIGKLFRTPLP